MGPLCLMKCVANDYSIKEVENESEFPVFSLTAFWNLCYSKYVLKKEQIKESIVRKAALAWELLFVVHAPDIRGSKKQMISSHVDGIFLRANNSCRIVVETDAMQSCLF